MNTALLIFATVGVVALVSFLSWFFRRKKPDLSWRIPWLTIIIFSVAIAPPLLGIFPREMQETYVPLVIVLLSAGICVLADYLAHRHLRPSIDRLWNSLFNKQTKVEKKNA